MIRRLLILFSLFGIIFLLALSSSFPKTNLFVKEIEASSVLSFPEDHSEHPTFNAEWWYLNLLTRTLKTDGTDQRDLAYVLSFSRILGSNNLLSSRYDDVSKSFGENTEQNGSLVVQLLDGNRLFVQFSKNLEISTLEELPTGIDRKRVYHLAGRTADMGVFDLTLKERSVVSSGFNSPLLWGGTTGNCQGRISVFSQDDTYYYSVPDLDISGTITENDGTERNVLIGKAWIDHQWFNSGPPTDWLGHYWTNLHFTHSTSLYSPGPHQAFGYVTQIYNDGPRYSYWVKRNTDGTNECGSDGTMIINSFGSTDYPNFWTVNNGILRANGYSFSDNQIYQPPTGPSFIEAASFYSGTLSGTPFTGLGFFETHLMLGDFNGDGEINSFEVKLLLSHWTQLDLPSYDLVEDNKINVLDLSTIINLWKP
ncbi:lipocalin-like domain-containing protein [Patescibacteria group bacterium]